jgi:hypothetical protein
MNMRLIVTLPISGVMNSLRRWLSSSEKQHSGCEEWIDKEKLMKKRFSGSRKEARNTSGLEAEPGNNSCHSRERGYRRANKRSATQTGQN